MAVQTKKSGLKHRPIDEERLGALLQSLAPALVGEVIATALAALVEAVEAYRNHFPVVETHSDPADPSKDWKWRTNGSLKNQRRQLKDLQLRISDLEEALSGLNYDTRRVLWRGYHGSSRLLAELVAAKEGVIEAFDSLSLESDHQEDSPRVVLAMDVAHILTGPLGLSVSTGICGPHDAVPAGNTSAAYCRTLQAALLEAGASPPADLRKLMRDGLELLREIQEDDRIIAESGAGQPAKAAPQRNGES